MKEIKQLKQLKTLANNYGVSYPSNREIFDSDMFFRITGIKLEKNKIMEKEVKLVSSCCGAEVDFSGGGYDGEDIIPIVEHCKKCGDRCEMTRIVPKGYKEEVMSF